MPKTAEKLYLFLAWWIKAYGYSPPKTTIAEMVGISEFAIDKWLNILATRGFIRLYKYQDGSYNAEVVVDPTRPWQAVLELGKNGLPVRLISEIPLQLHIFKPGDFRPDIVLAEKDLIKENLKKRGVIK